MVTDINNGHIKLFYDDFEKDVLLRTIILWVSVVISSLLMILDINLTILHIWLHSKNLTTYLYIVELRKGE